MRACDEEFADPPGNVSLISGESYGWVSDNAQIFSSDEELVLFGDRTFSTAADPLQSRLGSTLGLTLGRLLNLGAVPTFYLGRLGAAAIFVLLAMWAIKIAPFGQRMLMAVCLLPITVSLAASYSYDSAIISLSLLTFACFLRAIYGEGMLRRGDVIPLLALAVLLPPCKVVYSAIFGCAFLVPSRRFSTTGRAWAFKIGVIALALLAFASSRFATVASLVEVGESGGLNYRGSESGYMYTLSDIVSNPIGTILMFLRSFDVMGGRLWGETFGSNLGSLQGELTAPSWVYGSFFALTLAASVRSSDDNKTIPWGHALVMGIVGILAILAVWLFMYLDWTFTTETVIQGMQGRYALPLLPLFFIAIRNTSFAWNKRGSAISLVAAMGYLDVYYVLWVMATGLTL